jgi:hypothetical protein
MKTIISLIFLLSAASAALAQTTAFTYQGRLNDGAAAASGTYDFEFRLYDGGGTQIGAPQTVEDVTVTNGTFTVQLDFGASPFTSNQASSLEIRVRRGAETGAFTPLSPRQPLTGAPYAIKSVSAETAINAQNLGGAAANQFVQTNDARLSDARAPIAGSNFYIQNRNSGQQTADFNISGTGSASILNAETQYNFGGSRFIAANSGNGSTIVGLGTPSVLPPGTSLFGNRAGAALTNGGFNSFFGDRAGTNTTGGSSNAFFGDLAGSANTVGARNSIFGSSALRSNQAGSDNAAFGHEAGINMNGGNSNSFFGKHAGVNETGSDNTYVGRSAGDGSTNGSNNTAVGKSAQFGANNLSFATAIGANAVVSTSNTVVLGRSFDTAKIPGKLEVSGAVTTGGNVGVGTGTTTPAARLQVSGGDVYVSTIGAGVILRSPNGNCFRLNVNDAGALSAAAVTCP